ncbi:MAG: YceI family protein [Isosphaeraceae bacterium]
MNPRTAGFAALLIGTAAATAGAADTYKVDAVHSAVVFRVKHMNASYAYGRFNDIAGTFTLDGTAPQSMAFQVKVDSIDTANAQRDTHLKAADFFDAAKYPAIQFESKSVKKAGEAYEVSGDLTLKGVTKPVTAKLEVVGTGKGPTGGAIAGIEATFVIKRTEFNMPTGAPNMIGDEVRLVVSIEGAK